MAWQLEQNLGVGAYGLVFHWFKGLLYLGTSAVGVWRRDVAGLWTQVFNGGATGVWRTTKWNGQLWHLDGSKVYRSFDGTTWVEDFDIGTLCDPATRALTLNASGDRLYVSGWLPVPNSYFLERDTLGNWSLSLPTDTSGNLYTEFVHFGSYYYVWLNAGDYYRWNGTAWEAVPGITRGGSITVHDDGYAYATRANVSTSTPVYWIDPNTDVWTLATSWAGICHYTIISIGADGCLWFCTHTSTFGWTYVYHKLPGYGPGSGWRRFSYTNTSGRGMSAIIDGGNNVFFATHDPAGISVYRYVPTFALHPPQSGGAGALGLAPQAMDCDGDGNVLYLGLYEVAGDPVLIRVALPLTPISLGLSIFAPGAGDAINVKCCTVGQKLAVAGNFDWDEQVEISEDGGLNWIDIDRDAWDAETAQPLVVSPTTLDEVMVALATAQDITETFDAGATAWIVNNAAIGYSPGAMAKLPDGDEILIGDDAANRIDYSPNRGQTLTDITAPFVGNVAALEVV